MVRLKKIVRSSKILKKIYLVVGSLVINLLSVFITVNQKQILFISYGGESFNDSPRNIYEAIKKDKRFKDYSIVWALDSNAKKNAENSNQIKIVNPNSVIYFYHLFKSKIWITNVSVQRGLDIKYKNRIVINTWHGTPLKKIGKDVSKKRVWRRKSRQQYRNLANNKIYFLSQSNYEEQIFKRAFGINDENILKLGLPRNDKLFSNEKVVKNFAINSLSDEKQILLYAPTWRDSNKESYLDLIEIKKVLDENQILLFRGHHAMQDIYSKDVFDSQVIDVSKYPNVTDLLLISDILISDYSSIIVDYSVLNRPIMLYLPDYYLYSKTRGLYFNLFKEFGENCTKSQTKIFSHIRTRNFPDSKKIKRYFSIYGGQSTIEIVDKIYEEICYQIV